MQYTIQISDRNYSKWKIIPTNLQDPSIVNQNLDNFRPFEHKVFHGDILKITSETIALLKSPFLEDHSIIPAVLILSDGKTYGRTENKKKLLYRCVPNNISLPVFLVPYDISLELSKHIINKYVLIHFKHWNDKHPRGELVETIGNVNNYDSCEKYQLYCKNLHISISPFTKYIKSVCCFNESDKITCLSEKYNLIDRTSEYVFSIDNDSTTDFDDAISITDFKTGVMTVSIYIANVVAWLEILNGWESFSEQVSTIYLPSKKYSMLPNILSDNYCSLLEKKERLAIAIDFTIDINGNIIDNRFNNTKIIVKKNFRYEEEKLLKNTYYKMLLTMTQQLDNTIMDSHSVIAYWMIKTNEVVGNYLYSNKTGIFRYTKTGLGNNIENKIKNIKLERIIFGIKNNICSEYEVFEDGNQYIHSIMQITNYLHITSPIRRLVDLLNQIELQKLMGYIQSSESQTFLQKWKTKIDFINHQMKSIRKVQTICDMLHLCVYTKRFSQDNSFIGIIVNCENNKLQTIHEFEYLVYIESVKYMFVAKSTEVFSLYDHVTCVIYSFDEKDTIQQKIVLQIFRV